MSSGSNNGVGIRIIDEHSACGKECFLLYKSSLSG